MDDARPAPAGSCLSDTLLFGTPYRPTQRLGRGGMGEVIEAEHVGLGKAVVVKLLHRDLNARPHLVERLRVEAQALARLAHPNLVVVTDFGRTAEGRAFLVMERLHGRTFREELEARRALPPGEAIDYVAQALAGLEAAHGAGIVHRDVKLDNLFVCEPDAQGRRAVKVLDFGVAKVIGPGEGRAPAPSLYSTEEGVVVGTPRYLSPEQATGGPVDARADVYAAGLVLYALLAGRGPFAHVERLIDLLRAHAAEVPEPPSRHAPWPIPAALDRAVMKALEKEPDRRFQSAAAFAERLAAIREEFARRGTGGAPGGERTHGGRPEPAPGRWATTEPLEPVPARRVRAWTEPRRAPSAGLDAPGSLLLRLTVPLITAPVRPPRLAATLQDVAAARGWRSKDRAMVARSGLVVPVLVVGALLLGFVLAFLLVPAG